jgi:hypothetical protein
MARIRKRIDPLVLAGDVVGDLCDAASATSRSFARPNGAFTRFERCATVALGAVGIVVVVEL